MAAGLLLEKEKLRLLKPDRAEVKDIVTKTMHLITKKLREI